MKGRFTVKILIKDFKIEVKFFQGNRVIDEITWDDRNNLSLSLLFNIDKLLKKNKIKKEQLNNISVVSDQATYSSTRISMAIAKAGNYCLTK